MSETNRDDVDWAPAAEQSSEDDEAQTGNVLASEDEASDAAEHEALHVVADDGTEIDLDAVLDAMAEAVDPEADRAVDEALEVDDEEEAAAAQLAVEDEEEEAVADPYEAFRTELRSKLGKWYVIHSYAGFERRVKSNIENRMVSMNMEDYIYEVQVPMEDVVEIKNGQRKMVNRVRIPGYVLVRMDLNEDSWSVVRHTPGVTGFVGNAHNPTPLRFEEAFSMLKSLVQVEAAPAKGGAKGQKAAARVIPAEVDFEIGETITIKEGSFAGLPGSISEIKPESGKLTVLVSLFERETPVELSFDQVTKL
ncbi:transcription termination/antitermination protein NusG [Leifsonia xyli]|uniref:transcription termination/antitermination protein NusG n=1 Tax=Leifsonia xyli TaxID=1575 RepID=UPI003D664C76